MVAAARITDPITHTGSLTGMLLGIAAGMVVGAALVAAEVVTGGLATVAIVGLCAATGGGIGAFLGSLSWATSVTGNILGVGSPNVLINFLPAARAHIDLVLCAQHCPPPVPIAQGSDSVFINFMPAARVHDMSACSGLISKGSPDVFIGGGTRTTDPIEPEIPTWLSYTVAAVGLASAAVLFGPVAAVLGFAGGLLGGEAGNYVGGKLFGEGSDGQKISSFAGSFLGGALFGKVGGAADEGLGTQGLLMRGKAPTPPVVEETPRAAAADPLPAPAAPPDPAPAAPPPPPAKPPVDTSLPHNKFLQSQEYQDGLAKGGMPLRPVGSEGGGFITAEAGPIEGGATGKTLYRVGSKDGMWWSENPPPASMAEWQERDAVLPSWGNPGTELQTINIPPNEQIPMAWKGPGAPAIEVSGNGQVYQGGADQFFFSAKDPAIVNPAWRSPNPATTPWNTPATPPAAPPAPPPTNP